MLDPETGEPYRPCRPHPSRAVCHVDTCGYADTVDGRLSTAGRRALMKHLEAGREPEPTPPGHCDCRRCRDRGRDPLTPAEIDAVQHHLTDRLAVLFLLSYAVYDGCEICPHCGELFAVFADRVDTRGLIASGGCPYHGQHAGSPLGLGDSDG
ncbi:hypothetical protein [[Mycobacterium] crassicus]|uniref:DUF5318 domain-containing protein n=1 Tax=[Mycobacterium] crassicus TaxID=2872309 RepID=A0ABU5XF24_9MYCO|nr:hypothetical protein [Mycolicibacter sp. MYC098]MEB3020887.1 hypothetical protein [Mycolicibacter sp. MYC098]